MNAPLTPDTAAERRQASLLLDVLIRAGLVFALAALCYQIFAPFLTLMVWALILAVAMYPLHQMLARRIGGRQGLAATLIALVGAALIVAPTAALMGSLADSVQDLVHGVQNNTLQIPPPRPGVAEWPVVGEKLHAYWSQAHSDLPALVQSLQPKIGNLAKAALGFVAGIGGGLLMFLAAFLIAGVIMAFGAEGARSQRGHLRPHHEPGARPRVRQAVDGDGSCGRAGRHRRGVDPGHRGRRHAARRPGAAGRRARRDRARARHRADTGVAGHRPGHRLHLDERPVRHRPAVIYSVVLFVAGMADNFLKPLMLGRGVDAPMPVILLGALGGMAAAGILGLFVGAVLLALGYQIFMGWVHHDRPESESQPTG